MFADSLAATRTSPLGLFVSLPETTTLAEKQTQLLDGAPTFVDLDILEERLLAGPQELVQR